MGQGRREAVAEQVAAPTAGIRRATTTKEVADRLRAEIQRGDLLPGTRLRQNEVARRFGVSTTPVREAFALLEADGLVQIDPHRGALVFRASADDVLESYEIREALEVLALTKAIPNLTEARVGELQEMIDTMRAMDDDDRWLDWNTRFHLGLYAAADRPRLASLIANLRDASGAYIRMYVQRKAHADDEHQAILDAAAAGDASRARQALREHLRRTVSTLVQVLKDESSGPEGGRSRPRR
jgi:DNA-binding GntR family transcriptional regulator